MPQVNRTYSPIALSKALNLIRAGMDASPRTQLLDMIFPRKEGNDGARLEWDIIDGSRDILPYLSIDSPAHIGTLTSDQTLTADAPRLAEKRRIPAALLQLLREPGTRHMQRANYRIGREQMDMLRKIDTTREYLAGQALQGKVVLIDKAGTTREIAKWTVPNSDQIKTGANKLAGGGEWTSSEANPLDEIRTQKRNIEESVNGGVEKWFGVAGHETMKSLYKNAELRAMAGTSNSVAGKQRLADLLEIDELIPYNRRYKKDEQTWTDVIDQDYFILVGWSDEYFSEQFIPAVQIGAQDDKRWQAQTMPADVDSWTLYSKTWKEEDPGAEWILVEQRSLPVMHAPGAVSIMETQ